MLFSRKGMDKKKVISMTDGTSVVWAFATARLPVAEEQTNNSLLLPKWRPVNIGYYERNPLNLAKDVQT